MEQITAAEIQPIDDATLATVLECALDLQVPVTLFYAVLDRLARPAPWYPQLLRRASGRIRASRGA